MPNVCPAVGMCLTGLVSSLLLGGVAAEGQDLSSSYSQAGARPPYRYSPWEGPELDDPEWGSPHTQQYAPPGGLASVSSDVLRHPLTAKARRLIQKALEEADRGDHLAAIQDLHEMLSKYPSSAAYADNLLGVENMETNQFAKAKSFFEEAVRLMPNESVNHTNLGLALAITGEWDSAEREARKALQLDRGNAKAKALLDILLVDQGSKSTPGLLTGQP
jgi:Flp pilus assembly protein TadD